MARADGVIFPVTMSWGESEDRSDYRPVPASDKGIGYADRGQLGDRSPNGGEPYDPPAEIKFEGGFGATSAELRAGFCAVPMRNEPAHDLDNYKERLSRPRVSETDQDAREFMDSDWEFQNRQRRSKGFLTRPHIPIER